jgi:hypothetical protein
METTIKDLVKFNTFLAILMEEHKREGTLYLNFGKERSSLEYTDKNLESIKMSTRDTKMANLDRFEVLKLALTSGITFQEGRELERRFLERLKEQGIEYSRT